MVKMSAPISVIIPCYRASSTIARALKSVFMQTVQPSEVILIDDGSGDSTSSVLYELQKQHPGLIKVIALDQNLGVSNARNIGWKNASQPFIAFLDSDDAWHYKKIEVQYAYMEAHPEVVLTAHDCRVLPSDEGLPDWGIREVAQVQLISKKNLLISNQFVTPSVMLRRSIEKRFIEDRRHMEDHMLWLEILFSGGRIDKLLTPLAAIYKRAFGDSGLSSQLIEMQKGDLSNYKNLLRMHYISHIQWVALSTYSCLKFMRRLLIVVANNLVKSLRR